MKSEKVLLIFALAQKSSALIHYSLLLITCPPGSRPVSAVVGSIVISPPPGETQTGGQESAEC